MRQTKKRLGWNFILLCCIWLMTAGCAAQSVEQQVETRLSHLTAEQKVGQLLMIGLYGTELNDDHRWMLQQYHVGGVVLFDRNLQTKAQAKKLTAGLQGAADLPLFIALDEEGGRVARGRKLIEAPPAQLDVAATGKPELAAQWAAKTAKRMQTLGINVNFAPVADLGSFNTRHYSTDAAVVTQFVQAAAKGYESAGMLYTLKHFPGIGKGRTDTHLGKCVVDVPRAVLEAEDLCPYRELFATHAQENYLVMVSHAIFPQLTGESPASLSPETGKLLREEMGYNGLLVTDDLEMNGVAVCPFTEIGVRAVQAGADIVLVCHDYQHQQEVYHGLLEAVKKGEITGERLDASVRRILRAKLKYLKGWK